jgi:hypothetical protein
MANFELEVYKAFKTALYGTVTYGGSTVPYYADSNTHDDSGIYIGSYQEQEEDSKDRFGARCFVTLVVFSINDGADVTNDIANTIKGLIKASVSTTITSATVSICLTKSPRIVRFTDLDGGNTLHRVEMTYELLCFEN